MSDVSHRDYDGDATFGTATMSGLGSPEAVVTASVGAVYRRLDGGTSTTFYVKESGANTNTGWVAYGAASVNAATITALQAADVVLTAADAALDTRLDAIEANNWVTTARIADEAVTVAEIQAASETLIGRGSPGTGAAHAVTVSGGIEWVNGTSIQRSALTGDVTASLGSGSTTIANDAVTNAKLANMATQTFKGRTTAGTGDPEDLTVTQATAMLNVANATTKGLVPTPPNNTTTYLRGDATFAAPPKKRAFMMFGAQTITAGNDRFACPPGIAVNPISTTGFYLPCPVTGSVVALVYWATTGSMSSGTITVAPRLDGVEQTTQKVTINHPITGNARVAFGTPFSVTAGTNAIACQIDHTGAGTTGACTFAFEIEYD